MSQELEVGSVYHLSPPTAIHRPRIDLEDRHRRNHKRVMITTIPSIRNRIHLLKPRKSSTITLTLTLKPQDPTIGDVNIVLFSNSRSY